MKLKTFFLHSGNRTLAAYGTTHLRRQAISEVRRTGNAVDVTDTTGKLLFSYRFNASTNRVRRYAIGE